MEHIDDLAFLLLFSVSPDPGCIGLCQQSGAQPSISYSPDDVEYTGIGP